MSYDYKPKIEPCPNCGYSVDGICSCVLSWQRVEESKE